MNKPGWISFCGWSVIALMGFSFGDAMVHVLAGIDIVPTPVLGTLGLMAFPLFFLWFVGTVVWHYKLLGARATASAMQQMLTQSGGLGQLANLPRPAPAPIQPAAIYAVCQSCKKGNSVVHCRKHGTSLCTSCLAAHNVQGQCDYISLAELRPAWPGPGATHKRVATSPLDLSKINPARD